MRSKQIHISSNDKIKSSVSNSDFVIKLKQTDAIQNCKKIVIDNISFINTFSNISESNNTLTFRDPNNPSEIIEVSIQAGQYTLEEFLSALETEINLSITPETISITQDPITKKLVFTSTIPIGWFGQYNGNEMGPVLGFDDNLNSTPALVYEATNFPDLSGPRLIFIQSESLSNLTSLIDGSSRIFSVVKTIPLKSDFGCPEIFIADMIETNEIIFPEPVNISNIDIKISDKLGKILDLGGLDFNMVIRSYY